MATTRKVSSMLDYMNGDGDHVRLLLSCGHFSKPIHSASSVFDHPSEPVYCIQCAASKFLNSRLIKFLERLNKKKAREKNVEHV